jgi:hypothetical protein
MILAQTSQMLKQKLLHLGSCQEQQQFNRAWLRYLASVTKNEPAGQQALTR